MRVKNALTGFLIFTLLSLFPVAAFSQSDESIELNGFLMATFTGRTTRERPGGVEGGDFLLAEERIRLDISSWAESVEASLRVRADFIHDAITDEFDIDIREAYIDYTTGDFDFRLGRQIATWGLGDLLFINDVFPKDWVSFFSGRPLQYLKTGVDGGRMHYSSDVLNAELIAVPFFTPDNLPTTQRFFLYDPFASVTTRYESRPETTYGNTEFAMRLYRNISSFDISFYGYKGFWRTPSMRPDNFMAPTSVTVFYPDLSIYGFSATGNAFEGIISFETGFYHSRDDEDGEDPAIPNSQFRFLVGYQRQLRNDFTLGVQYYSEIMKDYSAYTNSLPGGFPVQKEYRDTFTLRLTRLLKHQTWKLSLFTFYNRADNDYLILPEVSYKFSDKFSGTLGGNIFGGENEDSSLGQFDKNDNFYISARFDF